MWIFSIGFEAYHPSSDGNWIYSFRKLYNLKVAYLIEKDAGREKAWRDHRTAGRERAAGKQVLLVVLNKNKKFQKEN